MCGRVLQLIFFLSLLFIRTESFSQLQNGNREVIYSAKSGGIRFNNAHDTLGVKYGNGIYFTRWVAMEDGKTIMDANIYFFDLNKSETEVLKPVERADNDYEHKGGIINLLIDNVQGRLFFTSIENQKNLGLDGAVSWYYDLKTKQENIYKEGKIADIDSKGMVSVLTNGSDYKGSYTQIIKYNSKGMGIYFGKRIYDIK